MKRQRKNRRLKTDKYEGRGETEKAKHFSILISYAREAISHRRSPFVILLAVLHCHAMCADSEPQLCLRTAVTHCRLSNLLSEYSGTYHGSPGLPWLSGRPRDSCTDPTIHDSLQPLASQSPDTQDPHLSS
jgi:hypothetical protein